MKDKFPEIYKSKVDRLKSKIQKEYYYHNWKEENIEADETKLISKPGLIKKINNIFKRPNYVYQADITILYKNGKNMNKKIIGMKDNALLTIEGERISIDDIYDIK